MVVCAVDDLMFSSKISTSARLLGAEVRFVRAADEVLSTVRALMPALAVFDLNAGRLRPMEAIAAMKADPALCGIRTLGYVSHVQTDVIAAARAAGCDEVLARSAFAQQLGEILAAGR